MIVDKSMATKASSACSGENGDYRGCAIVDLVEFYPGFMMYL